MVNRKGFVVFFRNHKVRKEIENIANVTYVSKKNKYLIAYCDAKRYKGYAKQIRQVKGVSSVIESLYDMTNLTFEENVSVK
ncbi:DUF2129 domain-containing protein [Mycoplasmatota bacterium]|nr:DUF2129 domain-containing protein [Mycoplasmatota bacterium]